MYKIGSKIRPTPLYGNTATSAVLLAVGGSSRKRRQLDQHTRRIGEFSSRSGARKPQLAVAQNIIMTLENDTTGRPIHAVLGQYSVPICPSNSCLDYAQACYALLAHPIFTHQLPNSPVFIRIRKRTKLNISIPTEEFCYLILPS
ncbi:hypothetical protein KQX54_014779 [Cotesia glomerata]|uniref:Uncharacterized protein n=1 Tax=Cotesia glomerata TaxID=32391 RepID=A0AAV7ISV2_COTGL|nr:hypothetical protein KQX54_014779 [Cotesia glomerata]